MIIYLVTNLVNGKTYVGQTRQPILSRWSQHVYEAREGSSYFLHQAIRKYGKDSFKIEELYRADSQKELNEKERHFIQVYHSFCADSGYNQTMGGDGWSGNEASRRKLSVSMTGRIFSAEHRRKLSEAKKGKAPWNKGRVLTH